MVMCTYIIQLSHFSLLRLVPLCPVCRQREVALSAHVLQQLTSRGTLQQTPNAVVCMHLHARVCMCVCVCVCEDNREADLRIDSCWCWDMATAYLATAANAYLSSDEIDDLHLSVVVQPQLHAGGVKVKAMHSLHQRHDINATHLTTED